jgi:penicillin-insensitive murein endopeptidase
MKASIFFLALLTYSIGFGQSDQQFLDSIEVVKKSTENLTIEAYQKMHIGDTLPSISKGSVGNGELINGHLMPYEGHNFRYFDEVSYKSGRAFMNNKAAKAVLHCYETLVQSLPNRIFYLMECSNQFGGEMHPHKTHQNGLSVDFMMPLLKDGKPYIGLDTIGADHYWLTFDDAGQYEKDKSIVIDFNTIALHLLTLEKSARKFGMRLSKVIIKIELKEELFATHYGKQLKESNIYVVQKLNPTVNALHDEHYHVDFAFL